MNKFTIVLILLILVSCLSRNNRAKLFPIDPSELIYKKGDCLSFQIDSVNKGVAIVIDHSKDEGGLWYGLCFTNYFDSLMPNVSDIKDLKVFGRKIHTSLNESGFMVGIDIEFVNDSCIKLNNSKFILIGNVNLNSNNVMIGAEGATNDYSDMLCSFHYGLERRVLPPDDYRDHIKKINHFRPDEYFELKDFTILE
jgi:hypothetical protein